MRFYIMHVRNGVHGMGQTDENQDIGNRKMDKTNQNQTEKKNAGAAKRMAGKRSPGRSREPKWDKLDNTAHLFPVIAGDDMTNVYRISVVLKEPVVGTILQDALDMVLPKFDGFNVRLRQGIFWYYL